MSDERVFTNPVFLIGMGLTFVTLIPLLVNARTRPDVFWLRVVYAIGLVALVYVLFFMITLLFLFFGGPLVWLVVVCWILLRVMDSWEDQQLE